MDLKERVRALPRAPGVYLWQGSGGEVLYIGKAVDLRARCSQYLAGRDDKAQRIVREATDLDYIAVTSEKEALVLEQTLIKRHRPRYNVRLTDDKSYPYLKLTDEAYPRLVKTYRHAEDRGTYFGPFPDGYGAFHVMRTLNDLLPLRRCKTLPQEKCLYYDIGKCVAPCIGACTDAEYDALVSEAADILRGRARDVARRLRQRMEEAAAAQRFEEAARLRDQIHGLEGVLERQHMTAASLEDRDIAALEARGTVGVVVVLHQRDGKIIGQSPFLVRGVDTESGAEALADFLRGHYAERTVPRHITADLPEPVRAALEADLRLLRGGAVTVESPQRGQKRRWVDVAAENARLRMEQESVRAARRGMGAVEALQRALGLEAPPRVIEGFDVSHHAGAHTRAAMVRFVDGEPDKSGYRIFGMREVGEDAVAAGTAAARGAGREVDDPMSLREAVLRRYRRLAAEGEALPDLVLVDGGPTQLAAARQALEEAGVHVPLAALAKRDEEVHLPGRMNPLRLRRDDAGLQLLQRVRDEAHRFGIGQVRRKATAATVGGPLEDVPGIGPARRRELVRAFGGLEGLRQASIDDLVRVPGITRATAEKVVAALRA